MTTYPIFGTRRDRLVAWLAFNGITLRRKKGLDVVRIERRGKRALTLWLRDSGRTAAFVGARDSHRSRTLDRLMRAWNRAEQYVPGGTHSRVFVELETKADHDVQGMVDYYRANPIGLESIGLERVTHDWNGKRGKAGRVIERRFVLIPDLIDLVTSLTTRQAYVDELARRDAAFTAPVPTPTAPLPLGQLSFDFAA